VTDTPSCFTASVPWSLPPDTGQEVTLTFRLASCSGFLSATDLPVSRLPLTVDRWWGKQHLMVPVDAVVPNPCDASI
jgi:hypothetical protein